MKNLKNTWKFILSIYVEKKHLRRTEKLDRTTWKLNRWIVLEVESFQENVLQEGFIKGGVGRTASPINIKEKVLIEQESLNF
mgnify:CR=1 FL=1